VKPFVVGCSEKYGDKLKFGVVNTGANKRLAIGQRVMGIPTMVVYEGGEKLETLGKDDASEANIEALVQRYI
jgi:thioredoxin 1